MDITEAQTLRDDLNGLDCVEAPSEDNTDVTFWLCRVNQSGYESGDPHYEVVLQARNNRTHPLMLPNELLEEVQQRGFYLRVDNDEEHVRVRSGL